MTALPLFSASDWISANFIGAESLRPETVGVVSSFTLMWNLFEATVCSGNANVSAFVNLAADINRRHEGLRDVQYAVDFWRSRYVTQSRLNALFEGLNFRGNDRREDVEAVLRGERSDFTSQLLAVLIITYRLRNNLFHGLKAIGTLNHQVGNLDAACRVLASILQASGVDG